jgi:phage terminase small subunit
MADEKEKEEKEISPKHQKFVDEYVKCWNGTQAYKVVYPKCTTETASANAADLLRNTKVQDYLKSRLAESQMSADEALQRMADMARADVAKFIDADLNGWDVNLFQVVDGQVIAKPETKFVKKLRKKETTDKFGAVTVTTEIEMYSAQEALDKILRVYGKYQDNLDIKSGGKPIVPITVIEVIKSNE